MLRPEQVIYYSTLKWIETNACQENKIWNNMLCTDNLGRSENKKLQQFSFLLLGPILWEGMLWVSPKYLSLYKVFGHLIKKSLLDIYSTSLWSSIKSVVDVHLGWNLVTDKNMACDSDHLTHHVLNGSMCIFFMFLHLLFRRFSINFSAVCTYILLSYRNTCQGEPVPLLFLLLLVLVSFALLTETSTGR